MPTLTSVQTKALAYRLSMRRGSVHRLDVTCHTQVHVLRPRVNLARDIYRSKEIHMHDIIDTAVAAGTFKTLAAAVTAADLVATLKSPGPFTVFAPSDEAFAKLPAGTVESLLKDIPKLKAILTYHVVAGTVMAADVMTMNGKTAATVNGALLKISTAGGVKLNGEVNVVKTDIGCTNGVIHVIDSVLLPSA